MNEQVEKISNEQLDRIIETSQGVGSREYIYQIAVELKKRRASINCSHTDELVPIYTEDGYVQCQGCCEFIKVEELQKNE